MRNLIKKYPTVCGFVLLLGIFCAFYLGLCALGLLSPWVAEHFQLDLTAPYEEKLATNVLLYLPVAGLPLLFVLLQAGIFVVVAGCVVVVLSAGIYQSAKLLGAWLSSK